jgi:hypothetical protein
LWCKDAREVVVVAVAATAFCRPVATTTVKLKMQFYPSKKDKPICTLGF